MNGQIDPANTEGKLAFPQGIKNTYNVTLNDRVISSPDYQNDELDDQDDPHQKFQKQRNKKGKNIKV